MNSTAPDSYLYKNNSGHMGTEAMKLELIEWLAGLKDQAIVASLFNLKQVNEAEDWYLGLTPEQKASIARGVEDAKAGRVVSSEEMWKRYGRTKKG